MSTPTWEAIAAHLYGQLDHIGCTCTFPSKDCCGATMYESAMEGIVAPDPVPELLKALQPFADAARVLGAVAPDGIDDGLMVLAYVHARVERDHEFSTAHFTAARVAYTRATGAA